MQQFWKVLWVNKMMGALGHVLETKMSMTSADAPLYGMPLALGGQSNKMAVWLCMTYTPQAV